MRTITILLIEDNTQDIRLINEMLKEIRSFNYDLVSAITLKEGCEQIQRNNFDIILLDLNLPDSTGQQTFQKVIDCCKEIPVVLITGIEDEELSLKLIMEGAQDYIAKHSLNLAILGKAIQYSIERQALLKNIKTQNVQINRIEKERILIAKFPSQNPDPVLRVAINGKLLYINEAGIKLLPDWQLIINETIPSRLKDIIDPVFIEGTNIEFELAHREFIYSFYAVPLIEDGYINLYGRDITERKQAEEALQINETLFRELFDNMKSGSAIFTVINDGSKGSDYIIKKINRIGLKMEEKALEEVVGKRFIDIRPTIDNYGLIPVMKKTWETGKSGILQVSIYIDEHYSNFYENYVFKLPSGEIVTLYDDVTERKQAEEALRESEQRLNFHINNSPLATIEWNADFIVTRWSGEAEKIFGWNQSETIGKPIMDFPIIYDEDIPIVQKTMERLSDGSSKHVVSTNRNYTKNRKVIYCVWYNSVLLSSQGKMISVMSQVMDITERKEAEDALRESEEKHRTILQTAMDGFWMVDMQGHLLEVNATYCRMSGYSAQELLTLHISNLEAAELAAYTADHIQKIKSQGEDRFETRHRRKDGSIFDVEVSVQYQFVDDGRFVVFIQDISERKQAEQELIIAKERAEESDELKTAFLNNISHEIRTPFNGILGFLSIIQDCDLTSSERDEYIDIINKSAYRLMNTINDIVEISQIQAGQIKLTASETNIKSLTGELFDHFKTDAESQGLEFTINNDLPDSMDCIFTDRIKLKTVLSILIGNAIKFTKAGSVELGIHKKDTYLEFSVKDTGIGISENKKQVIFERFMQVDVSNTRQFEGSGLGLSISTAYAEMLGGKIWVESEEGKGSVFYFTIPYNAEPEEKNVVRKVVLTEGMENPINPKVSGLKILIVEDDETSEKLISITVNKLSKEVIKARTGNAAVEICRKNPDIDLVLMDIQMWDMNGYEATRQIRQFNKDVVIIAQTAFGLSGDREKAIDAGCNDYISKPINKAELHAIIQKHLKKQLTTYN